MNAGPSLSEQRRERRWESRRELIVRAAAEVIAEMGLERATLDAVGERVGLSKASLYYYVKSKEELLGHVIAHVLATQEEAMAALMRDGMTAEERLRAFCLGHLRSLFADPAGRIAARVALSDIRDEPVRAPLRAYMARLEAILDDGVAEGTFRPVDWRIVRYSLFSALNAVVLWYSPGGPLTVEEVGDRICDLVIGGLRPSDGGGPYNN
jgi:TetR/AcrR family transcriptional regulator, cholesterol catabolism regulator